MDKIADRKISMKNDKSVNIVTNYYFPCGVYTFDDKSNIKNVLNVSNEYLADKSKCHLGDEIYPVTQTINFAGDPRIADFVNNIGRAAWHILDSQGYDMSAYDMWIGELWCQEHKLNSGHDVHIHGNNGQICGFYFLEAEEGCVKALVHDPKHAKVYASLPEKNEEDITLATKIVNFDVKPGSFILMNTWLPHSFTRNKSKKPFKFIHFNIGVKPSVAIPQPATVI